MTKWLGAVCALLVLVSLASPASGGGAQSRLPSKTLVKTKAADGTAYELTAQLYRRERPYLVVQLSYDRTVTNPDGSGDSEGGGSTSEHFVADTKHPFRLDSFVENEPCRDVVVFGSVAPSVKRVVAVRADGTTRAIRRQRPPASWHYRGRLIGSYIGRGPVTTRVRIVGSRGHLLGSFRVPNEANVTCHPSRS